VTPAGARRAGIAVDEGSVVGIAADELLPLAKASFDAAGKLILPGLVDPEGHPGVYSPLNDDLTSESRAAVVAGVTTWGIQAPSARLGHPRFAEFVRPDDVVSFHEVFGHLVGAVESDSGPTSS
jgi:dihydropyrimidinase